MRTNPEIIEPRGQRLRVHLVPASQFGNFDIALCVGGLARGFETVGCVGENSLAPFHQVAADFPHITEQQIRPAGRDQAGLFQNDEMIFIAITRIGSD